MTPPTCPRCGEDHPTLVEWDPVLRVWHCAVCSGRWRLHRATWPLWRQELWQFRAEERWMRLAFGD